MIALHPFDRSDFGRLIAEIPDARFLLQWAGPKYSFPLDETQLAQTLSYTAGEQPNCQVFKAVAITDLTEVGHIQLMDIDHRAASCVLGRVLIFQAFRGCGYGRAMVRAALGVAFDRLGLNEVTLGVFDFNTPAIHTYRRIGFTPYQFNEAVRPFRNERWSVIKMKLSADQWLPEQGKGSPYRRSR